jgi:hypothetical protein
MEDLTEIQKGKLAVMQQALGLCALPEGEFYQALEKLYWLGFKAGDEYRKTEEDRTNDSAKA